MRKTSPGRQGPKAAARLLDALGRILKAAKDAEQARDELRREGARSK
jgi:hypothetical protein